MFIRTASCTGLAQAGAAFAAERITGTVVDPGGMTGRSATVPFSIYIYDHSTDQEVERLAGVLAQKGSEALRQELWDLEKGWIRIGNSLGYPVAVARSQPGRESFTCHAGKAPGRAGALRLWRVGWAFP